MADEVKKDENVSTSSKHRDGVSPTPWRVADRMSETIVDSLNRVQASAANAKTAALIIEAVNERERMKLDLADERSRSDRLLQQLSNEASDNARLRDELRQETEAAHRYFEAASAATDAYNNLRDLVRRLCDELESHYHEPESMDDPCIVREAREAIGEGKA